ncbi:MAG: phenylalanine--tRNA ligase subunit alpha [Candidatus Cloacimonetes bacterium 4572_65]|nr:MAG: phenylalanine--tRNA ligase subunit alpha [Candidatus Cloacimonetes bacterium 4572_65]
MKEKLQQIITHAEEELKSIVKKHELLNVKSRLIGKKSALTELMKTMKEVPAEKRREFGKMINETKNYLQELIDTRNGVIDELIYKEQIESSRIDLTMPGRRTVQGGLHPLTKIWREIEDTFISMGFEIADGPDVEDEFHNFDALNAPADHPSRDLADTFYVKDNVLLRTQTSTIQIRVAENHNPPIRIIAPGRCYRNDKMDASHSPVFHQVEAFVIDENVTFADLKDTLNIFVKLMFGKGVKSRIRPHFFPFTEPSAEIDISCVSCGGEGCRICSGSGWLEMGGAGMVDPAVLQNVGIDSEKYTGFAFGLGIDRITMLKYNIPDIRVLFENDLRFLKQYK